MTVASPYEIPSGWQWATLSDVAEVDLGKMLSRKAFAEELEQRPYLRNQNVRWGSIDFSDLKQMGFKPGELDRYGLTFGDLLVCEGGEPGRCAIYRGESGGLMYQKALHRVRALDPSFDLLFVRHLLEYYALAGIAFPRMSETTIKHLPREKMLTLPVPVAPCAEAARLVLRVEEELSRLDAASGELLEARKKMDSYRASVLKTACEGRLVPTEAELARAEGREYEPAGQLLARMLKERRARWEADHLAKLTAKGKPPKDDSRKRKYVDPESSDTMELSRLPNGWGWATVEQLSEPERPVTYGVVKLGPPVEGGVPTLRSSNVRRLRLDLNGLKRISPEVARLYKRTFLKGGEVLVTVRGTLGGVVVAPGACTGFNVSREVAVIAPCLPEVSSWIAHYIASQPGDSWIAKNLKGIAYTGLNIETLNRMPIALPPLAEQPRIVAEVERRLSIADEAEVTIETALTRAERLRQAILKRAFEGKLVPQDPNDEPASVLLERIRKQREAETEAKSSQRSPGRAGARRRPPRRA